MRVEGSGRKLSPTALESGFKESKFQSGGSEFQRLTNASYSQTREKNKIEIDLFFCHIGQ